MCICLVCLCACIRGADGVDMSEIAIPSWSAHAGDGHDDGMTVTSCGKQALAIAMTLLWLYDACGTRMSHSECTVLVRQCKLFEAHTIYTHRTTFTVRVYIHLL